MIGIPSIQFSVFSSQYSVLGVLDTEYRIRNIEYRISDTEHRILRFTEGETRALLTSAGLVVLAALGRTALAPPEARPRLEGLGTAGDVDSALAVAESIYAESERRSRPLQPGQRLDPNLADEVELDRLPGVGRSKARAIVRDRRARGPFATLDDLERVPGLGPTLLERLAPYVTLRPRRARPREPARSDRAGPDRPGGDGPSDAPTGPLDLNRATAGELTGLPGIGPARAAAIVRWRETHGPFRRAEDLLAVPGIGPGTVERLRGRVLQALDTPAGGPQL